MNQPAGDGAVDGRDARTPLRARRRSVVPAEVQFFDDDDSLSIVLPLLTMEHRGQERSRGRMLCEGGRSQRIGNRHHHLGPHAA